MERVFDAIGKPVNIKWLSFGDTHTVPAAFDVSVRGPRAAFASLLRIRQAIQQNVRREDFLLFEWLTAREHFIAWPNKRAEVGRTKEPNIYWSYAKFFGQPLACPLPSVEPRSIVLFPDSRKPDKILTPEVITEIGRECAKRSLPLRCILIGKPSPHGVLPGVQGVPDLRVEWIDGFDSLVSAVKTADIVVSADSLPAHIAEYFGVPVFVFTPVQNDYWMPASSFQHGGFALFNDLPAFGNWLDRVIAR